MKGYEFPINIFMLYRKFITKLSLFFSTLRVKILFFFLGCSHGKDLRVDGKTVIHIDKKGSIRFGENVEINSRFSANLVGMTNPTVFQCIGNGSIHIGDNSGCSSTVFSSRCNITIGRNVKIGGNVRIFDHDYHPLDYKQRTNVYLPDTGIPSYPVIIGDDVFIGTNAFILKGVKIGDRSIIGAGAVVSIKNIPPDSLVVGNPAKIVSKSKNNVAPCPLPTLARIV